MNNHSEKNNKKKTYKLIVLTIDVWDVKYEKLTDKEIIFATGFMEQNLHTLTLKLVYSL